MPPLASQSYVSSAATSSKMPQVCEGPFRHPIPGKVDSIPSSGYHQTVESTPTRIEISNQDRHDPSTSWDIIFQSRFKEVNEKCAAWKDEINNLLLFASLFSAIVTAFVAPLSTDDHSRNVTDVVEALWFGSLILSIATVTLGITSLQWLREHQRYVDFPDPKSAVAVLQMRQESLDSWGVQWIFYGLPFLLLIAVVFFLAGMIFFLIQFNKKVAIFSITLISLIFLFLLLTTIIPAIHDLEYFCRPPFALRLWSFVKSLPSLAKSYISIRRTTADDPPSSDIPDPTSTPLDTRSVKIDSPCPYKSPQSWIFRMLMRRLFSPIVSWKRSPGRYLVFADHQHRKSLFVPISSTADKEQFDPGRHPRNWSESDLRWTWRRDWCANSEANLKEWDPQNKLRPKYDHVKVLTRIINQSNDADLLLAAYHCFAQISREAVTTYGNDDADDPRLEECPSNKKRNSFLRRHYFQGFQIPTSPLTDALIALKSGLSWKTSHEENLLTFCQMYASSTLVEHRTAAYFFGAHMVELHSRVLGTLVTFLLAGDAALGLENDDVLNSLVSKCKNLELSTTLQKASYYSFWSHGDFDPKVPVRRDVGIEFAMQLDVIQCTIIEHLSRCVSLNRGPNDSAQVLQFASMFCQYASNMIIRGYQASLEQGSGPASLVTSLSTTVSPVPPTSTISTASTTSVVPTTSLAPTAPISIPAIAVNSTTSVDNTSANRLMTESSFSYLKQKFEERLQGDADLSPGSADFDLLFACYILSFLYETEEDRDNKIDITGNFISGFVKTLLTYEKRVLAERKTNDLVEFKETWGKSMLPILPTHSLAIISIDGKASKSFEFKTRIPVPLLPFWLQDELTTHCGSIFTDEELVSLEESEMRGIEISDWVDNWTWATPNPGLEL